MESIPCSMCRSRNHSTAEHKRRIKIANSQPRSAEHRRKLGLARLGKSGKSPDPKVEAERVRKIILAQRGRAPRYGRPTFTYERDGQR